MKPFCWSSEKNAELLAERGITFEQVVVAVDAGGLLDVLSHPNPGKYPNQRIMVVDYTVKGEKLASGKPRLWSDKRFANTGNTQNLDLSPDGKRFAVVLPAEGPEPGHGGAR